MNAFDIETTRRLAIGLLVINGALLFKGADIILALLSTEEASHAARLRTPMLILSYSATTALIAFIFTEIAGHPKTPESGGRWSRANFLESAFALLVTTGFLSMVIGGHALLQVLLDLALVDQNRLP